MIIYTKSSLNPFKTGGEKEVFKKDREKKRWRQQMYVQPNRLYIV